MEPADPGSLSECKDEEVQAKATEESSEDAKLSAQSSQFCAGEANYDPTVPQHVLLQFEYLQHQKVVLWISYAANIAGFVAVLGYHDCCVEADSKGHPLMDSKVDDSVWIALFFCLVLAGICVMVKRVAAQHKSHKKWTLERQRIVWASCVVLLCQAISLICSLIPMLITASGICIFFSPFVTFCQFVRTTCTNTLFTTMLLVANECIRWIPEKGQLWSQHPWQHDTPKAFWRAHFKLLCVWASFEACALFEAIFILADPNLGRVISRAAYVKPPKGKAPAPAAAPAPVQLTDNCFEWNYTCRASTVVDIANGLHIPFFVLFLVLYWRLLSRGLTALHHQPYGEDTRFLNIVLRVQARLLGCPFVLTVLAGLYMYIVRMGKLATCTNYLNYTYGDVATQVCLSWLAVMMGMLTMPRRPHDPSLPLRLALGQLVWCEAELPERLAQLRVLAHQLAVEKGKASSGQVDEVPAPDAADVESQKVAGQEDLPADTPPLVLFCVETMVKLLYWSQFVYRYHKDPGKMERQTSITQLPVALSLYGLRQVEMMGSWWGGTRALLAWNRTTVVISLRGTANMRNVCCNMMAWRASHLPKRGRCCSRPLVHRGFQFSYRVGKLPSKVAAHIKEVVCKGQGVKEQDLTVYVTGHSLGGCLAMLCAFDISKVMTVGALRVYTFGAPRLGNQAFVREYNNRVPDTWHLINAKDSIPYSPRFGWLYRRGGHVALLNTHGDLIIKPTLLERRLLPRGGNIKPHFLGAYKAALARVCKNQVTGRSLPGGVPAVLGLAARLPLAHLLQEAALGAEALRERAAEFMSADESGRRAAMAASWYSSDSGEFGSEVEREMAEQALEEEALEEDEGAEVAVRIPIGAQPAQELSKEPPPGVIFVDLTTL